MHLQLKSLEYDGSTTISPSIALLCRINQSALNQAVNTVQQAESGLPCILNRRKAIYAAACRLQVVMPYRIVPIGYMLAHLHGASSA
jgi:hypothetical protein